MTAVDPVFAQWLQADGLWKVGSDAVLAARWGNVAQTTERMTSLANAADAGDEAARQIAFFGGPLAMETAVLPGAWATYQGRVITVVFDGLGYDAGLDVFVIGAQDDYATGISRVTLIRRL